MKSVRNAMGKMYKLGVYEKAMPDTLTWEERLGAAGECGFDYAEISIDETDRRLARLDMDRAGRRELLRAMDRSGVRIESMCLSGHRRFPLGSLDGDTRQRSLAILEKAVNLSAELGIRVIQIAGYDVYYEAGNSETRKWFGENLRLCVERAARQGVTLAFENMETPFMDTVEKAMGWVHEIDSPYLCVYPDTGNMVNGALKSGKGAALDLEAGRGKIAAVHLKEALPGKYREVPYGTGCVPFEALIRQAWRMGVRRYLAEFWCRGGDGWMNDMRFAAGFFKKILEAASQEGEKRPQYGRSEDRGDKHWEQRGIKY